MAHKRTQGDRGGSNTGVAAHGKAGRDGGPPEAEAALLVWEAALAARLRQASAGKSLREVGSVTSTNWETVRRYLAGGRVSGRFLATFSDAFGLNAEWLLHGVGPVQRLLDRENGVRGAVLTAILEVKGGKVGVREVRCEG
jgi:hypothetical protein